MWNLTRYSDRMYNVDILTPHKDPDTDCDGLTDGWEAISDLSINPYGPTNLTNRDSDNDGAIDGKMLNFKSSVSN